MLISMKCPNCGAEMQFDNTQDSMFCPFCGGKVVNMAQKVDINQNINVSGTVVNVADHTNEPNLYISYNTNNASVGMVTRIVSTGVKSTYVNGQTLSFHINQGPQQIVLKIGKKNYSRDIVIPSDNSPVRIYASFNGRAQITVDQPSITTAAPVSAPVATPIQQVQQPQVTTAPVQTQVASATKKSRSPLSILAFILSFTVYLSFVGAGLGAVDIFVLDKKNEKNHTFSYWAMGIGLILTIGLIMSLAGGKSKGNTTESVPATTAIVTTVEETTTVATTTTKSTEATTEATTETTTEATTEETTTEAAQEDSDKDGDGISDDLKAFLDSYEEYIDEYIEFLEKMADDPTNLELLTEYGKMMAKYAEFADAAEKYNPDVMSDADRTYYLETLARINQKIADASVSMST